MLLRILTLLALLAATSLTAGEPAVPGTKIPDFTFIHASDCHVPPGVARRTGPAGGPQFGTAEVVAQIKGLTDPIELRPYGVTVPAPSFALSTGDNTEFGGLDRVWEQYLGLWQDAPFPVFHVLGNHDNTWAAQRHRIRELHGSTYYSFNRHGCHFIGWDSATPQDPRPSFGEEGLEWLRADLKGVDPATPVFLFLHHPLNSTEFASSYERDRLLDLLRPYNLALLLVGHGHTAQRRVVAGVDQVMGGSTFGAAPGYSVVSVKDGVLRVAYRKAWEEAPLQPLLERPLNARPVYPAIRISAPAEGATITEPARIRVTIDRDDIVSARWQADDEKGREGELARAGAAWEASLNAREWEPGAHTLRLVFKSGGGAEYQRTTRFYTAGQQPRVLWRAFMKGSGKGSPVVDGDLVLAGAAGGVLYAFNRRDGKPRWQFRTGGEILARPLAAGGVFFVGSGDGSFYAVDRQGKERWSYKVGHPVYSSAVGVDGKIVLAANNGHVYALNFGDGSLAWENSAPGYSIESAPAVSEGRLYYGAWDGYVYAINSADGSLAWKTRGAGSATSLPGVARYYSPADAAPLVAGGKVWVADRMYRLTFMDAATGAVTGEAKSVASVARAGDGAAVYLRRTDGNLRKVDLDGKELWSVPARTSAVPSAPVEDGGAVYSASGTGRILAFNAADGGKLWEYQATPRLYVFSDPVAADGVVYVTGMDGSLTALRAR